MSITAVEARIAEIRSRFETTAPTSSTTFEPALAAASSVAKSGSSATVGASGDPGPPQVAGGLPAGATEWQPEVEAAARRAGVDPTLFTALVWAESGFRPDAVSHAGARGLAQLMPGTARGLGVDPDDPVQNLDGGARYLREQLDRFGRDDLALAAYNAGPARVARAGGIPQITETQNYVTRVLSYVDRLSR